MRWLATAAHKPAASGESDYPSARAEQEPASQNVKQPTLRRVSMKNTHLAGALVACLAAAALFPGASHAAVVPLDFSSAAGTYNDATFQGTLGCATLSDCYTTAANGSTLEGWLFTGVATDGVTTLDAIVTYTTLDDATTTFMEGGRYGVYPNYTPNLAEPNDDFGFLYNAVAVGTAGVDFTFSFYETGTLTPYVISELQIVGYDIDGGNGGGVLQDEYLIAYEDDGFVSYQLDSGTPMFVNCVDHDSNNINSTCTDPGEGAWRFDGTDSDRSETSTEGAVLLNFANTSSFTLTMGSYKAGGVPDAVFSAFDGDLSLFSLCSDEGADQDNCFGDPVAVPEPSVLWLLATGLIGITILRRRKAA
jgi:hypothetical protein